MDEKDIRITEEPKRKGPKKTDSMGHRFDSEVEKRISTVMQYYENMIASDPSDSSIVAAKKEIARNKLRDYRTKLNPLTSYNASRRNTDTHKAKALTLEALDSLFYAMDWTAKDFLELMLIENESFTPEDFFNRKNVKGWQKLEWPSKEMERLAKWLDDMGPEKRAQIEEYVDIFLPKSYNWFLENLQRDSSWFSQSGVYVPQYYDADKEKYPPEKRMDNMCDRIVDAVRFKLEKVEIADAMKAAGVDCNLRSIFKPYHWNIIRIKYFNRLSKGIGITPHWAFYGMRDICVLAENPETERIMDKYQFLADDYQVVIYNAVKNLYNEGVI